MQKEEIKNKLMEVIDENLPNIDSEKVDVTADFVEEYDINSIQLIQLIVAAEEKFDVSFDDRELALNKYNSFDDVIDTIENKVNQ
ncbi:MAG: phosphopantetheine-binding protein [Lachnospiraceae bacterium]|nr:phosphopantetheine-binding protein [Lachnospiraceae bacterium]